MVMIIGICGGTGSGKTTIARKVTESFSKDEVVLIEQDSYYLNLADMPLNKRQQANFDHPNAIDSKSIIENLKSLKNGEKVEVPIYDFKTHTRSEESQTIEPKPVIIIEGLLVFTERRIVDLLDLKVFVDTPDDIRLLRRIRRDIQERGRTLEQTLTQYEKTIRPMHNRFVEPTKRYADLIIPAENETDTAIDFLCRVIREKIQLEEAKSATK